jgi:nucleoside-diphosphate-sugar epimerase
MSTTHRHVVLGAGPVGRAVVAALAADGVRPVVVTRSGTEVEGAETRRADVSRPDGAADALRDAGVVYQCAQPVYHRWPQEFRAFQRSIVDAAASAGASVVAVENLYGYGPVDGPMRESTPLAATTRKGAVRAQMWHDLLDAHRSGRIRATAARASDFVGPGVEDSAIGERFLGQLLGGKAVDVLGDPDALHTVTFVPDLADAMVRLGRSDDAWGRPWHVPNAPAVTQRQLVERAAAIAGVEPRLRAVAPWQLRMLGLFVRPVRETIEMTYEFEHDFVVDSSDFERTFGVTATALDDALAATIAHARVHSGGSHSGGSHSGTGPDRDGSGVRAGS